MTIQMDRYNDKGEERLSSRIGRFVGEEIRETIPDIIRGADYLIEKGDQGLAFGGEGLSRGFTLLQRFMQRDILNHDKRNPDGTAWGKASDGLGFGQSEFDRIAE